MLKHKEELHIPSLADLPVSIAKERKFYQLGTLGEFNCFWVQTESYHELSVAFTAVSLRKLFNRINLAEKSLINLALHIDQWDQNSRFCGRCGGPTQLLKKQWGKSCKNCSFRVYPLISPCIIVAVIKDNNAILLAEIVKKDARFQSVLAGFIEAGENLEQGLIREVEEEVGIKIKNLNYFGSQAWSFSQSLMIAFVAEHESGEIKVDGQEIHYANWYTADNLPDLPPQYSIARELIEWFRKL